MSKQKILDFFELRDKIEETVRDYVQDTLMPLNDRWDIFKQSDLGYENYYIQRLESLHDDIVMYDGLVHVDRNQTISVFEILERYYEHKEDFEEESYNANKYLEWQKYKFDPIAFQEECLEKFVKGWVYDW